MEEKRKIKKYKMLKEYSQNRLSKETNKYLKKGWELQGGVSTSGGGLFAPRVSYSQAVVLYK